MTQTLAAALLEQLALTEGWDELKSHCLKVEVINVGDVDGMKPGEGYFGLCPVEAAHQEALTRTAHNEVSGDDPVTLSGTVTDPRYSLKARLLFYKKYMDLVLAANISGDTDLEQLLNLWIRAIALSMRNDCEEGPFFLAMLRTLTQQHDFDMRTTEFRHPMREPAPFEGNVPAVFEGSDDLLFSFHDLKAKDASNAYSVALEWFATAIVGSMQEFFFDHEKEGPILSPVWLGNFPDYPELRKSDEYPLAIETAKRDITRNREHYQELTARLELKARARAQKVQNAIDNMDNFRQKYLQSPG